MIQLQMWWHFGRDLYKVTACIYISISKTEKIILIKQSYHRPNTPGCQGLQRYTKGLKVKVDKLARGSGNLNPLHKILGWALVESWLCHNLMIQSGRLKIQWTCEEYSTTALNMISKMISYVLTCLLFFSFCERNLYNIPSIFSLFQYQFQEKALMKAQE